ncbi:MAG TPA: hypothetical protein DCZ72_08045 [Armatimonadetes bacterium]|nr:hypothetical protein [Armatimonadota bacterium]
MPEGWCWASVEQLAEIVSGKTPKGVDEVLRPDGAIPWFRVSDMNTPGNERTMQSWEQGLSRETASALGLQPQPGGTIIFPKRGGAIATNKRRQLAAPSCYDLNTMGFVPSNGMGRYLWHWFGTVDLRSLSDGSNVPQINHGDIMPLLVPLAPEPEQAAICDEVDRLLDVFGHAELLVKASTARAARLRQSILKHAFEGKLVPQDPTDEPADALLARIATERRAAAPKARPRRGRGDQP